jgi:glutamate racemase
MPNERIVYFGDTARMPYGAKTRETVTAYARQIINFLLTRRVKAVIIACGTVSSNSYGNLVNEYDVPLIEMVSTGARAVINATKTLRVGVLATESTIASGAHKDAIARICPEAEVFPKACPLFVPLIEEGWTGNDIAQAVSDVYVKEAAPPGMDALLLGCTHYPLLAKCIRRSAGPGVKVVDPAVCAAEAMHGLLTQRDMLRLAAEPPVHEMFVSDNTDKFRRICETVTGRAEDALMVRLD